MTRPQRQAIFITGAACQFIACLRNFDAKLNALLTVEPSGAQGHKLKAAIKRFRLHLFVFMTNRSIEPINNGSDQAIIPAVTFRKVTNCFRSEWDAKFYADVRSVLETAGRNAINPLIAIKQTLENQPVMQGGCNYRRTIG